MYFKRLILLLITLLCIISFPAAAYAAESSSAEDSETTVPEDSEPEEDEPVIIPAPSNLTILSENGVNTLTWSGIENSAYHYNIYRSSSPDWQQPQLIATVSDTSCTDASASSGTAWHYRVYTADPVSLLESNEYTEFSITPLAAPVITVTSPDYQSLTVKWKAVPGAESYEIYRGGKHIHSTAALSYTDTSLTTGTYYKYYVKAVTGNSSASSAKVSCKPTLATPSLSIGNTTYNSIKLTWKSVAGADGYEIYRSKTKEGTYSRIKSVTAASYTNSSLATGTTYYYQVRAYRLVNDKKVYSAFSTVKSSTPKLAVPSIHLNSVTYNTVTVSWTQVNGATSYRLYRSTSKDTGYTRIATLTTTFKYTDKDLKHGTTYYYKVRAVRGSSLSSSAMVSARPKCKAPAVALQQSSYKTVVLSWNKVTGATSYNVYRSTSKNGTYTKLLNTKNLTYTDTGLTKGTVYYYKIYGVRNGKLGTASTAKPSNLYLSAPSGLILRPVGSTPSAGARLLWNEVKGATHYAIYRSEKKDSGFTRIGSTDKTTYSDTTTRNNTTYYYKIKAYTGSVTSSYSTVKTFAFIKTARYHLSALTVGTGKTFTPVLTISPTYGLLRSCTFTSSNPKVAKVSAIGTITTLAPGTTTITCTPKNSSSSTALKLTVKDAVTVVLDPGHGGYDPGACSTFKGIDYNERDLNLRISQYTQKALSAYDGVIVYLTRTSNDVYYDLEERAAFSKEHLADVFICQHLNSSSNASAKGSEIYTSVNSKYRLTPLAKLFQSRLAAIGLTQRGIFSRSYSYDNPNTDYYGVIRHNVANGIPALLIENAFISSSSDVSKYLSSATRLKKVGTANAAAIADYYNLPAK